MKCISRLTVVTLAILAPSTFARAQQQSGTLAYTVSMDQPANHLYHIVLKCDGIKAEALDFKMPVWTPGYYGILNYAANVQNFAAADAAGNPLKFEKTADNTWRVQTAQAPAFTLTYDVLASRNFVANSFLDETRGYIMPGSLFLHPAGQVQHPVTLDIKPNPNWNTIATGLDTIAPNKPNTFAAPDFDILYDSPILMGNLEKFPSFQINGIPHDFYAYNPGQFDRQAFINDLKATVEQGVAIIGDIPYKHYTFLGIGPGQGGIEHLNSTSFGFSAGAGMDAPGGRNRELRFLAHEYFHHYNVKRIRPVILGPFDYDHANITNMLWVSEGFTVYYDVLMVARAGCMTRDETLEEFRKNIVAYENKTGHLFQSATQSSHDTWAQGSFGGRGRGGPVKTISYYDKGPVLGLLLDFKIRHETKNQKSLDTVMQTLYKQYYLDKKRGWTDDEFRAVCEAVAGVPLNENFDYASTTKDVDYAKYLGYAGLQLEAPKELPQPDLRFVIETKDGKLIITAMESDSSARRAGIQTLDEIKTLDGESLDANAFTDKIAAKKPGDKATLTLSRDNKDRQVVLNLDPKLERTFKMTPIPNPDPLQSAILTDWLKKH